MSKVKLGFSKLSVPEKIQAAKTIVGKITGNAAFPTPLPALSDVTNAINALEAAFEDAKGGGIAKTAFKHTQETVLVGLMTELAAYVGLASKGNTDTILSSGMQVRASRTPSQTMAAPVAVLTDTGKSEGEVAIKWQPVKACKAYLVQQSADGNTGWVDCGTCTRGKITIGGLTSGGKFWFRIRAIGAKGAGPWSSPAKGLAA
jgi:hypothetical protein